DSELVSARNGSSAALVPRFEKQGYSDQAVAARRKWVEEKTGATLTHVGSYSLSSQQMRGNIENAIGTIQMPVGVAGPLAIHGSHAQGTFYVPLATTEGALLRSYERGMVTLTRSGGVTTRLYLDENRVSPLFLFPDVAAARDFAGQLNQSFPIIRREAEAT